MPATGPKQQKDKDMKFQNAHTDFAKVIASRLEGNIIIDKGRVVCYNALKCVWNFEASEAVELHSCVREELHMAFADMHLHFNEGRPQYRCYGGVHPLLKNHGNIVPVRAEVKSMLGGHAPEPTDKAGLLPFNNGMVYDFIDGKALKVHRGIAPSFGSVALPELAN